MERTQASEQMLRSCFIYFAQAVNKLTGGNGYGQERILRIQEAIR